MEKVFEKWIYNESKKKNVCKVRMANEINRHHRNQNHNEYEFDISFLNIWMYHLLGKRIRWNNRKTTQSQTCGAFAWSHLRKCHYPWWIPSKSSTFILVTLPTHLFHLVFLIPALLRLFFSLITRIPALFIYLFNSMPMYSYPCTDNVMFGNVSFFHLNFNSWKNNIQLEFR